jgi:hypothetical protein
MTLRFAEPDSVDDRRMIQLIRNDRILRTEESFKEPAVGIETGRIENRVFHAQKLAQLSLELLMHTLGAADEAHARESIPPSVERLVGRPVHFRTLREAEVVVGAEVQNIAPVGQLDPGTLRRTDMALALPRAGLANAGELPFQMLLKAL